MSHYGPPGEPPPGPGPGQYGPPADPWGQRPTESWDAPATQPGGYRPPGPMVPDPGYGEHRYGAPGHGPPGHGPFGSPHAPPAPDLAPGPDLPPGYGLRDEPPQRPIGLYAVVAVIVILAAFGVGYALYLLSGDGDRQDALPPATPAPTGPASVAPEATRDNIGMNAAMALVNDCLVNDGSTAEPQMRIVPCDSEADQLYQVLEIFNERVEGEGPLANEQAQQVCRDTEGYTHHYYEVGETASFVLCMAERD